MIVIQYMVPGREPGIFCEQKCNFMSWLEFVPLGKVLSDHSDKWLKLFRVLVIEYLNVAIEAELLCVTSFFRYIVGSLL